MAERIREKFSFLDGVVAGGGALALIGVEDARAEEPNSHGLIWKVQADEWNSFELDETLTSITVTKYPEYRIVATAETGTVITIGESTIHREVLATGNHSPERNGPITKVRAVNLSDIYAVGVARQVYKKLGIGDWQRCDEGCKSESAEQRADSAFLDIDGFSSDEIYAVGWNGEVWLFDGKTSWERMQVPTNVALHGIRCASNGIAYVVGQNGLVLEGRRNTWQILEQDLTSETLRSVDELGGQIFIASDNFLYQLEGEALFPVYFDGEAVTCGHLHSDAQHMLSVGLKDVMLFDGSHWKSIV